jgi:hypothetical protein
METSRVNPEDWFLPVNLLSVVLAVVRGQRERWEPEHDDDLQALITQKQQAERNTARLRRIDPMHPQPNPAHALWDARHPGRR